MAHIFFLFLMYYYNSLEPGVQIILERYILHQIQISQEVYNCCPVDKSARFSLVTVVFA